MHLLMEGNYIEADGPVDQGIFGRFGESPQVLVPEIYSSAGFVRVCEAFRGHWRLLILGPVSSATLLGHNR